MVDELYRLVGRGDTAEPELVNVERDRMLGKRLLEASDMSSATTTSNSEALLYGDVGHAYRVIDRTGLTVEIVGHLFGANRRPSGQRGLYAHRRVSAEVIVPNAMRKLTIT